LEHGEQLPQRAEGVATLRRLERFRDILIAPVAVTARNHLRLIRTHEDEDRDVLRAGIAFEVG
jgi:hypothetical protein